jgi:hypothetical protein
MKLMDLLTTDIAREKYLVYVVEVRLEAFETATTVSRVLVFLCD